MLATVLKRLSLPAPKRFDELLAEIKAFSSTKDLDDDMCLVGLEVSRLVDAAG